MSARFFLGMAWFAYMLALVSGPMFSELFNRQPATDSLRAYTMAMGCFFLLLSIRAHLLSGSR